MTDLQYGYKFYATTSQAWDAMYEALQRATRSIYWEIYIFVDDKAGERFVNVLIEKARAGVEVKIIIDAIGSYNFSKAAEARLRGAGVDIFRYNRLYPEFRLTSWFSRLVHRNHRKVLIVDEEIVFLGGVNIGDEFHSWDDVYLKITGQVTRPLVRAFAKSYISAGGARNKVRYLLHPKLAQVYPEWKKKLNFINHSPTFRTRSAARRVYLRALEMAKESVDLITPYYVPDRRFLKALEQARKRGVKIRIFLPTRIDIKIVEWIARGYYALTAEAGAELYLLPEMHHGKAIVVDKKAGFVGSHNLTRRSHTWDAESGVLFNDVDMANELTELFNSWKIKASPFDSERWQKRGWWSRVKEWWARRIEDFL